MKDDNILAIATVCHEAHRAWCAANGDREHKPWEEAEQYQRDTTIWGIDLLIRFPDVSDQRPVRHVGGVDRRRDLGVALGAEGEGRLHWITTQFQT